MMLKTIAIFIFSVGVFIFGMSYHNIDLAVNAQNGLIDTNGLGFTKDLPTMYNNGMSGMVISMIMMIGSFSMLFGIKERFKDGSKLA
jgi:uncharacterized alpha/beta hydrolase family protein